MSRALASQSPLILGVEDEPQVRRFLKAALEGANYRWMEASTGAEALRRAAEYLPEIILLDLGLPDMEGIDVCREIRKWSRATIIVLSARGQDREKVALLDTGADDYLTKPFSCDELLARIRAGLRRMARQSSDSTSGTFTCGPLKIDFSARRVFIHELEIQLTPIEFKLLGALAARSGQIVTKSQLLTEVWGPHSVEQSNYLRVYMTYLRRKLQGANHIIRTEAGVGYGLECP